MNTTNSFWKWLALTTFTLSHITTSLAAAEIGTHQHEPGASPSMLKLNDGKKWATDAPLRKGMESIRAAMAAALPTIHTNKLSSAKYNALAQKTNNQVAYIVANCKLDPQADAQLHLIIADLLSGVEAMQGKMKGAKRQTGAVKALGALEKYDAYFDHPGWKPITH
ncbi:MAG: hypothetical protein A2Z01_00520 [Betaproteobacteria bacterium RBG_16_58_11]|nr:MAG: hypothetical protein A2Z01_00520 [Betaproteobacteria bacterium RBG_16_58_11]OGA00856.1 MAG: hypothetical protein A2Z44_02520 [Betaproteobacteria bacterium RBG_19FT_COMBO_58_11]